MLGKLYPGQDCSAARALELVGERWTLLILRDALFRHYTRFSQFQQSLEIAPNILTKRLNSLVDGGILWIGVAADRPDHRQYLLTEMGQGFKPVIMALTAWGDEWVRPGPVTFVHDECGTEVEPQFACGHCAESVDSKNIQVQRREGVARPV